jgi:oligoendopeptidase F
MSKLPHWDTTSIFPGLDSPEFNNACASAIAGIEQLQTLFDTHHVGEDNHTLSVSEYEIVTKAFNMLLAEKRVVDAYLAAFITTESTNDVAKARNSEMMRESVTLNILSTRYINAIGKLNISELLANSETARQHQYFLEKTVIASTHLMDTPTENFFSEMRLASGSAWTQLRGDITSQMLVDLEGESIPMTAIRALATESDRNVRKSSYEAEIRAWKTVEVPIAAALNAIKQETNTLCKHRGWEDALEEACFGNSIDKATLSAMLSAAKKSFPMWRRYLKAKAKLVSGGDALPWYDIAAPVGASKRAWDWDEATAFVTQHFSSFSPKMGAFAKEAFDKGWIDAQPRAGKRDGAFCMGVRPGDSLVLQNYRPSFDAVSTLAHELGHAYHNRCLKDRLPLQKSTPMTLAETASIFCETIITHAALKDADRDERLMILEGSLQGQCQVVVDITSRFLFESRVLEKRKNRELSTQELCDLMLESQKETYGDGLDENCLHPYMWAVKGHYYGSTFYNFPYMFGLLFSLGLYAQYQANPDAFKARYDDLLSRTGMASAIDLAKEFGIDIQTEAFWASSLAVIEKDILAFEALAK